MKALFQHERVLLVLQKFTSTTFASTPSKVIIKLEILQNVYKKREFITYPNETVMEMHPNQPRSKTRVLSHCFLDSLSNNILCRGAFVAVEAHFQGRGGRQRQAHFQGRGRERHRQCCHSSQEEGQTSTKGCKLRNHPTTPHFHN